MRLAITLLLVLPMLLVGCNAPLTPPRARETAIAGGCWPYGVSQPISTAGPPVMPGPGSPTTTPIPAQIIYPTCVPGIGVPTITPVPTNTPTPIPIPTSQPPGAIGGRQEIGDVAGVVVPWARWSRTPALAVHPKRGLAAVAWLAWEAGEDGDVAQLWVRVQQPSGVWNSAQTLNLRPVGRYFGGLGVTFAPNNTLSVAYGGGMYGGDTAIALTESDDWGRSWSEPTPLGISGRVLDLVADQQGGLHLFAIGPDGFDGDAIYGYRAPGSTWTFQSELPGPAPQHGAFTVLNRADGGVRRIALLIRDSAAFIVQSDDGQQWEAQQLDTNRYLADESIIASSIVAAARPGGDLIAVAWSQIPGPGNARGGTYAVISTDAGANWGKQEQIAQHERDGALFDLDGNGLRGGFEPALIYDAATDMLICTWVEDDLALRGTQFGANVRTVISGRSLTNPERWRFARTPENADEVLLELAPWGFRGWLWGSGDGRWHWLLTVEERNHQQRIVVQPMTLSFLFAEGDS